jgi:hypothetical protein
MSKSGPAVLSNKLQQRSIDWRKQGCPRAQEEGIYVGNDSARHRTRDTPLVTERFEVRVQRDEE